jgi:glycolate oxidase FAD binding subunit
MGHLGPLLSVSLKVMPLPMKDTTIQRQLSAQDALEWFESLRGTHAPISASSWWAGEACVRLSGSSEVIADCLAHQPTHQTLSDEHADAHWQACQNQTHPVFQDGSLKRVSLPLASADLHEGHTLIEWGGALRWVSQATSEERLRQKVTAMGGTLTAWPCDVTAQTHQLEPALARLNHSIKRVFDPKGLYVPELEAAWKSA